MDNPPRRACSNNLFSIEHVAGLGGSFGDTPTPPPTKIQPWAIHALQWVRSKTRLDIEILRQRPRRDEVQKEWCPLAKLKVAAVRLVNTAKDVRQLRTWPPCSFRSEVNQIVHLLAATFFECDPETEVLPQPA